MKILKWYAIVIIVASFIRYLYKAGKDGEAFWIVMLAALLEMPIILYLIIS